MYFIDGEPEIMAKRTNAHDFLKRKADAADLNDGEESASRLEKKARLRGQCAAAGSFL